jgi:DNA-binding NarL/FixJ family response regulator
VSRNAGRWRRRSCDAHRVSDLVAEGMKNREIADVLFVSESTVEATLWRVYRKLGMRSRTELTRWITTGH